MLLLFCTMMELPSDQLCVGQLSSFVSSHVIMLSQIHVSLHLALDYDLDVDP